jgi:ribonuclease HI
VKHVILFTDGSCLGNPGPGGWAYLLRCGSVEKELSGTESHTTNNRMELQAVIAGLSALKEPCAVRVVTDSQYVQRAMTRHLARWIARGWVNSRGVLVSNRDLWRRCCGRAAGTKSRGPGFEGMARAPNKIGATNLRRPPPVV